MPEPDHDIRWGLERLTSPGDTATPLTFERLETRRRRRQARNTALVVVPIVALLALVVGLTTFRSDDGGTNVATGADRDPSAPVGASPRVTVLRTEVVGNGAGTVRVVMDFDGPLPQGEVGYVDEITAFEAADQLAYTIQPAGSVHVCDATHSFPPPAEGTVDLLIPADWFAEGPDTHTSPLMTSGNPSKFVVCGPFKDYFQYSIWGPASADPEDVTVTLDTTRSRLTVSLTGDLGEDDAEDLIASLLALAADPSADAVARLPFADEVALGLGGDLHQVRSPAELADPDAWRINVDIFRAYEGTFSALELLAEQRDTVVFVGEHSHCASPPVPPPDAVADFRRVSVQPAPSSIDTCLKWWTVDLFLNDNAKIEAVTLDLWEP